MGVETRRHRVRPGVQGVSVESSQSQSSTKSLLRRGRLGDRSALDRLFVRVLRPLRNFMHGRVPRRARGLTETNDLLQDAAVGVWRRIDQLQLDEPGDLEAYVRQAVWNRIRDEARRADRTPEFESLSPTLAAEAVSPVDRMVAAADWAMCRKAISKLPIDQRECLIAHFDYGYRYDEIAAMLDKVSPNAVRMLILRGLSRLADLVES